MGVRMNRYYFHIRDGQSLVRDEEGMDCRDLIAARHEALCSARDLALEAFKSGSLQPPATIEVEDEDGNAVEDLAPRPVLH